MAESQTYSATYSLIDMSHGNEGLRRISLLRIMICLWFDSFTGTQFVAGTQFVSKIVSGAKFRTQIVPRGLNVRPAQDNIPIKCRSVFNCTQIISKLINSIVSLKKNVILRRRHI